MSRDFARSDDIILSPKTLEYTLITHIYWIFMRKEGCFRLTIPKANNARLMGINKGLIVYLISRKIATLSQKHH